MAKRKSTKKVKRLVKLGERDRCPNCHSIDFKKRITEGDYRCKFCGGTFNYPIYSWENSEKISTPGSRYPPTSYTPIRYNPSSHSSTSYTPTSNPPNTRACFVTTAAYGEDHHPMVESFRSLRDDVLVNYKSGRKFIDWYDCNGPSLASIIKQRPLLCTAARAILTPIAKVVNATRSVLKRLA